MKIGLSHHFWTPPLESYLGPELAHKFTPPHCPMDPTKGVLRTKCEVYLGTLLSVGPSGPYLRTLRPLCHELCHGTSLRGSKFAALFLWGNPPTGSRTVLSDEA